MEPISGIGGPADVGMSRFLNAMTSQQLAAAALIAVMMPQQPAAPAPAPPAEPTPAVPKVEGAGGGGHVDLYA